MKFLLIFSIITNILADGILVVKDKNGSIIETSTIISSARIKKERAEKEAQLKAQKEKEEKERKNREWQENQKRLAKEQDKKINEYMNKIFNQVKEQHKRILGTKEEDYQMIENLLNKKNK